MQDPKSHRDAALPTTTRFLLRGLMACSLVPSLIYLWHTMVGISSWNFELLIPLALVLSPVAALPLLILLFLAGQNRQNQCIRAALLCLLPSLILSSSFDLIALFNWLNDSLNLAQLIDSEQINTLNRCFSLCVATVLCFGLTRHEEGFLRIWVMPLLLIIGLGGLQILDIKSGFFSEHLATMAGIGCVTTLFNTALLGKAAWERQSSLILALAWGAALQLANQLLYLRHNPGPLQPELLLIVNLNDLFSFFVVLPSLVDGILRHIRKPVSELNPLLMAKNAEDQASAAAFHQGLLQAKTELLNKLSHEFKTPLNTIIGYSELLMEELEESKLPLLSDDVYKVNKAGWHMMTLVDDLLDLAILEDQGIKLRETTIDAERFMNLLELMARKLADPLLTRIRCYCPKGFGLIQADEPRLLQVCMNVLRNAIRYTKNGEITVHFYPFILNDKTYFNIDIRDSGPGMADDEIKRIFNAFERIQADTSETIYGISLGLPVTMHLCELMQGKLSVDSSPSLGSTFSLSFLDKMDRKQLPLHSLATAPDAPLLLIDEDLESNQLLCRLLQAAGVPTQSTLLGRSGMRLILEIQPRVVMVDLKLPILEGLNLLRSIRLLHPNCLIISSSSDGSPDTRQSALDAGANLFFAKPVAVEAVVASIQRQQRAA